MDYCPGIGHYNSRNRECQLCKITASCRRELVKITKKRMRKKFKSVPQKILIMKVIINMMRFIGEPQSTRLIHQSVKNAGYRISVDTVRNYLDELHDNNRMVRLWEGHGYFWINPYNYSKYGAKHANS
jgi:Fe2+ or Zn2+ uptake regulation protein